MLAARVVLVLALARPGVVAADPAAPSVTAHAEGSADSSAPVVVMPLPPAMRDGLGATSEGAEDTHQLGRYVQLKLGGRWWHNRDDDRGHTAIDLEARGWGAGGALSVDLGFARLDVTAAWQRVDTRYGGGHYRDVGVALVRNFRLSRWMHAWISLGIGQRQWLDGVPPPGEADGTTVMLTFGTTFR